MEDKKKPKSETNLTIAEIKEPIDNPADDEKDFYKQLFETYAKWRALPMPLIKKMTRSQMLEQAGIDNEEMLDLAEIKTQNEFAEIHHIHINTLSRWNKRLLDRDPLHEARQWAKYLSKNLIFSLYARAVKSGDPFRIELYFKVVNQWEEKYKPTSEYRGVTEFNISIAPPKEDAKLNDGNKNIVAADVEASRSNALPAGQGN